MANEGEHGGDEPGNGSEAAPRGGNEASRTTADEHDRFIDEELIPILVIGGLILLLFPEPVTSSLGVVLVAVGLGLWLWDLLS